MAFRDYPKPTRIIILGTFVATLACFLASLAIFPWHPMAPWEFLLAVVLCSCLSFVQIRLTADKSRMSLSFAGLLGVAILLGPTNAAVIGLIEGAAGNLVVIDPVTDKRRFSKPDPIKLAFNAFNHALSACLAGLVYVLVTGGRVGLEVIHEQKAILPGLLATTVYYLVNTLDTAAVIASTRRDDGKPARRSSYKSWLLYRIYKVWHDDFFWTAPQYLASASAVIGFLWLISLNTWYSFAALLFLPIIGVVYYSFQLYMTKLREDLAHIKELKDLNESVIGSLAASIDAKDHYTNKHLSRVQEYSMAMLDWLENNMPEHIGHLKAKDPELELNDITEAVKCGAMVHDIGKLGVPEHILTKPGKLTPDEFKRMQQHVEIGAAILEPVNFKWPVVKVVMGHHERWDGMGYPHGIKGEEIHIGARIVSLADVFDALTSDRPYRKAMTFEEALKYVQNEAGKHFDPKCVEALLAVKAKCEENLEKEKYRDGEMKALDSVATSTGISEEVMQKIARANSEFYAMYDMSRSIPGPRPLDETLQAVIERIDKLVPFTTCCIYLENGAEDLKVRAAAGLYSDRLMGMRMDVGEGLSGRVFQQLDPIVNGAATLDVGRKIPPSETVELNSSLVVALRANGQTMGTISVYHSSYNIYTEDHARLLGMVAEHAANGIESARRLHQTEEMALTDPLTGLPNARSLNNWLTRRLEESILSHEAFAVVLMDLDRFKAVNDELGHVRGDEVLRDVAQAMQACVRTGDMLARYAGDEFVLVVPHADGIRISQLTQRVSEAVEALNPGGGIRLGVSAGFALYPDDALNARDLIALADSRMYENKNERRKT